MAPTLPEVDPDRLRQQALRLVRRIIIAVVAAGNLRRRITLERDGMEFDHAIDAEFQMRG